ncbi:hypothetical protein [Echinicola soli]|nr:hypothetical protein [Echinicola soli]
MASDRPAYGTRQACLAPDRLAVTGRGSELLRSRAIGTGYTSPF